MREQVPAVAVPSAPGETMRAWIVAFLLLGGCVGQFVTDPFIGGIPFPGETAAPADPGAADFVSAGAAAEPWSETSVAFPCVSDETTAAGVWRDLDDWPFMEAIATQRLDASYGGGWGFDIQRRLPIEVVTSAGVPAFDVPLSLRRPDGETVWSARTDVEGHAELWDGLFADSSSFGEEELMVYLNGESTGRAVSERDFGWVPLEFTADTTSQTAALQVALVVEATMAEELSWLQCGAAALVDEVQEELGQDLEIQVQVTAFHAASDGTSSESFTGDVSQLSRQLEAIEASREGEGQATLPEALSQVTSSEAWREEGASRLVVLFADAGPTDAEGLGQLHEAVRDAASRGIRITPFAGSDAGMEVEFLLRYLAAATGGRYAFFHRSALDDDPRSPSLIGRYTPQASEVLFKRLLIEAVQGAQ